MAESLALAYRPRKFRDMIGQRITALVLQQMVETGSVPTALLFSGPSGVGKTSAARILADALDNRLEDREMRDTDRESMLIPSVNRIEIDAASNGGVAEIRKLLDGLRYAPPVNEHWVVILDEAHSITRQGFEAFLKTLEEPPAQTVFVLVTTEPHKIPDTILSRLIEFQFRSINAAEILDRLRLVAEKESIDASPELLHYLAQRSDGNMRSALQSLEAVWRASIKTVEEYREMAGDHDPAPSLMAALMTGNHDQIFTLLDKQLSTIGSPGQITASVVECIRDLFVLKAGGNLQVVGASLESRRELARRLEPERLLFAVKTLWEVKTRLRGSDDPRGTLELALILIAEAFTRGKTISPPVAVSPSLSAPSESSTQASEMPRTQPRKLTLAELQQKEL